MINYIKIFDHAPSKITSRYYSLSKEEQFVPITYNRHNWTSEEVGIIDYYLFHGTENQAALTLPYIPPATLEYFINKRKTELAMRPMHPLEAPQFNFYICLQENVLTKI